MIIGNRFLVIDLCPEIIEFIPVVIFQKMSAIRDIIHEIPV